MATNCYPTTADWTCLPTGTTLDPELKAVAEMQGWQALRILTGFQTGNCPATVRPCTQGCYSQTWIEAPVGQLYLASGTFAPRIVDGMWVNSCGCTDSCSCTTLPSIQLPGPIGEVVTVKVDGVILPATSYLVVGDRLVRIDGERWPVCQDLTAPDTEVGTFSVTYRQGYPIDDLVNIAAGILSWEFYKACTGDSSCRLPANVQNVSRLGVSIEVSGGIFAGPLTNIPEVDVVIQMLNPYGLKTPPAVWSPSKRRAS